MPAAQLTALTTGLGALPLLSCRAVTPRNIALSNCGAAGMCLAASLSLALEGLNSDKPDTRARVGLGCLLGYLFIVATRSFLQRCAPRPAAGGRPPEPLVPPAAGPASRACCRARGPWPHEAIRARSLRTARIGSSAATPRSPRLPLAAARSRPALRLLGRRHEDLKFSVMQGANAQKTLLLIVVMTAHSFAEGIGIGVSFTDRTQFGVYVSTALAIHNIPEGLAVALVLVPQGTSVLKAAAWAVMSSLPQPLMALPAFLFVQHFGGLLPIGLGFAAAAMAHVACFELLPVSARLFARLLAPLPMRRARGPLTATRRSAPAAPRAQESRQEMSKAKGTDAELLAVLGGSFAAMLAVQFALHEVSE